MPQGAIMAKDSKRQRYEFTMNLGQDKISFKIENVINRLSRLHHSLHRAEKPATLCRIEQQSQLNFFRAEERETAHGAIYEGVD